jgi:hypothetical protein
LKRAEVFFAPLCRKQFKKSKADTKKHNKLSKKHQKIPHISKNNKKGTKNTQKKTQKKHPTNTNSIKPRF